VTQIAAVVGGHVLVDDGFESTDVLMDGAQIGGIEESTSPAAASQGITIDASGMLVTPGLIDIHIHGLRGYSFADADANGIAEMGRYLAHEGVTSYVASLASAGTDDLERALSRLDDYAGEAAEARMLGAHLEGPFLAPAQRGAHATRELRSPSEADVELIRRWARMIRMITVAPEIDGVLGLTEELAEELRVVVAAGHSDADGDALRALQAAGGTHITHLWSGQSMLRRDGPWRVPGMLEASLASTGMTAEVIADGKHLPAALLEIARRCLGDDLVVVSDGTPGTGMPDGFRYRLGEVECVVSDGVGVVVGADSFGGSTTTLAEMVRYLALDLEWGRAEVFRMATENAARAVGVDDERGRIAAGLVADLVVWDSALRPVAVIRDGCRVA